jgi:hypothetical protein
MKPISLEQNRLRNRCSVARVNGESPTAWSESRSKFYVGRHVPLFSGRWAPAHWPKTSFGNEFKFVKEDADEDKRQKLSMYLCRLDEEMNSIPGSRVGELFKSMIAARVRKNITIGCWCLNWDGSGIVPLCHAAYLARCLDWFRDKRVDQVQVTYDGVFWPNHQSPDPDVVVLRRPL